MLVYTSPVIAVDADNTLVIEVAGGTSGTVEIELLPDLAPEHVKRIKELTRSKAYDGVVFHRVIDGFMAQTGDVQFGNRKRTGDGTPGFGGSELPNLDQEFSAEPHVEGVVSMARSKDLNSANSQFFIVIGDAKFLDGKYTVFGRVISGMETVHEIKKGEGRSGAVTNPDYMASVYLKSEL